MLMIFNLDWTQFDVDTQVASANRKLNGLAAEKGVGHYVVFNTASLGAGERITDHARRIEAARQVDPDFDRKALEKGLSEEDLARLASRPDERTMDYLRRRHHRVARDIANTDDAKAYRDAAEMLASLKKQGHALAVTHTGPTKEAELALKRARVVDFFEDAVFGYDRLPAQDSDLTGRGLYFQAMRTLQTAPSDSIVVADTPEAIEAALPVKPRVIAAYLTPYRDRDQIDARLTEMKSSGAQYIFRGGHHVAGLPNFLFGRKALKSTMDQVMGRFTGGSGPAAP